METSRIAMPKKKPIKVELVQEGSARVIVSTFTGGEVVRVPVEVKKATRRPFRPHKKLGMTGAAVLNVQKRVEAHLDNVQTVVRDYCNAWAESDPEKRMELLKRSWSDHGVYQDPRSHVSGREALHEHIGAFF